MANFIVKSLTATILVGTAKIYFFIRRRYTKRREIYFLSQVKRTDFKNDKKIGELSHEMDAFYDVAYINCELHVVCDKIDSEGFEKIIHKY